MRWMPHPVRRSRMKSATRAAMSFLSVGVSCEDGCGDRAETGRDGNRAAADVELEEQAARLRLLVEAAAGGEVARHRLEEVPRTLAFERLVGLLLVVADSREHAIEESRSEFLAVDRLDRRPADDELAPAMGGCVRDRLDCNLGLEDRRHRLRMPRQLRPAPAELRRV